MTIYSHWTLLEDFVIDPAFAEALITWAYREFTEEKDVLDCVLELVIRYHPELVFEDHRY